MTREKFEALAEAYGGEIARWPADVREAAALVVAAEPEFASAVLAREVALDIALDAAPRALVSAQLFNAILAQAPAPRPRRHWFNWLAPAGLTAALAAAATAGVILGLQVGERSFLTTDQAAQTSTALDVSAIAEDG